MNISKETIEILDTLFMYSFTDDNINNVDPINATQLNLTFNKELNDCISYLGKTIKATKKEITIDYILNKINSDKTFKNFSNYFNSIISKFGLNAYPTSYGIGIFVLFGFRNSITETKNQISKCLNELGIKFDTEYSDAHWVFRYKISKASENIKLIEEILNKQ